MKHNITTNDNVIGFNIKNFISFVTSWITKENCWESSMSKIGSMFW